MKLVYRIFDIIFAEGALTTILRFSISMLKRNEAELLARTEFEDILNYLKGESLFSVYGDDYEMAVRDGMDESMTISHELLEIMKLRYDILRKLTRIRFEDEHVSAEISAMRSLVSRLRSDSLKMLKSLNALTERNAVLERENSEFGVFKKGTEIEIESLRNELLECRNQLDIKEREKKDLEGRIQVVTNSGDLSLRNSLSE
jgi:hypothetical protein